VEDGSVDLLVTAGDADVAVVAPAGATVEALVRRLFPD
jgi:hypothetical protein